LIASELCLTGGVGSSRQSMAHEVTPGSRNLTRAAPATHQFTIFHSPFFILHSLLKNEKWRMENAK
jgi:hypothetical protein